jgi:excisionase family DNA binding protein
MEEWMTIKESAKYLKMSIPGIRKYVNNGKLPGYRQGRIIRLKLSDLDALLTLTPVKTYRKRKTS